VRSTAMAMATPPIRKKTTGNAKPPKTCVGRKPGTVPSRTSASSDVTPSGAASSAHRSAIAAAMPRTVCPARSRPAAGGSTRHAAKTSRAAVQMSRREEIIDLSLSRRFYTSGGAP